MVELFVRNAYISKPNRMKGFEQMTNASGINFALGIVFLIAAAGAGVFSMLEGRKPLAGIILTVLGVGFCEIAAILSR